MSTNFTVDDTSPVLVYSPWGEGIGGWRTWYSESGYNSVPGVIPNGTSYHITTTDGISLSWQFYGQAIYLYGMANCSYDVYLDGLLQELPPNAYVGQLFDNTNVPLGSHNISISPHPAQDEVFAFDQAIITFDAAATVSVDNYDGRVQYINLPFHWTQSYGASFTFEFTNANAIDARADILTGHQLYNVYLDETELHMNGTSLWLVGDTSIFFQGGLDVSQPHNLTITNISPSGVLTLTSIAVYANSSGSVAVQPSISTGTAGSGTSNISSTSTKSDSHLSPGIQAAIAVPSAIAGVVLLVLGFLLWRCVRQKYQTIPKDTGSTSAPVQPFLLGHRPSRPPSAADDVHDAVGQGSSPAPARATMEQIVDGVFDRLRYHQPTSQPDSNATDGPGEPPPEYPGTPQQRVTPPDTNGKRRRWRTG